MMVSIHNSVLIYLDSKMNQTCMDSNSATFSFGVLLILFVF